MAGALALPVQRLAVGGAQHVDGTGIHEDLQVAVHGGQTDRVPASAEFGVQILGAAETDALLEQRLDRRALPRGADPSHAWERYRPSASLQLTTVFMSYWRGGDLVVGRPGRILAACVLVTVVAGCGVASGSGAQAGADGRLRVVATTTQVADFAREVGGDRAEVTGVLRPNVDPHDYEPSPADLTTMNHAQVLVRNGVGVEQWLDGAIDSSGYSGPVVDASHGVRLRAGDGEHGGEHGGEHQGSDADVDPHIWQDPGNAKVMVADI